MFRSRDIRFSIFNHTMIYQIYDVMMSIEAGCIFDQIFWTTIH